MLLGLAHNEALEGGEGCRDGVGSVSRLAMDQSIVRAWREDSKGLCDEQSCMLNA